MAGQTRQLLDQTTSAIKLVLFMGAALLIACNLGAGQTAVTNEPVDSTSSIRAQLVGTWHLVSRQSKRENGELEPDPGLSTVPLGILIYDQSGHVAAQLSRRDRTVAMIGEECQAATAIKGTPDNSQTILGYDAYFGHNHTPSGGGSLARRCRERHRSAVHHLR